MDDGLTLSTFFEAWELFREAALTGLVAGGLLGVLGVYVVLRRLVFLTAAVSQAAGLGVVGAFYAQLHFGLAWLSPTLGAAGATLAAVALVLLGRRGVSAQHDDLLGVAWLVGAAGTVAVGTRVVQEVQDVQTLLFGTAVAVVPEDFHRVALVAGVLLVVHAWGWRGFTAVSFDPDGARVRGLPARGLDVLLFATLAVAVSVTTRVVGALPTFAFSVLPAVAALRLAPNVQTALVIAGVVGAGTGFAGYVLAFLWELPVGATQTLLGVAVAGVAALLGAGLRRLTAAG